MRLRSRVSLNEVKKMASARIFRFMTSSAFLTATLNRNCLKYW